MAATSQFSIEEENFYKDIQDLVKKNSHTGKELCTFLQRYMDMLSRADLDDETFIVNFTKAAYILEASTKVYGTKVDSLWTNLERVLDSLKVKGQNGRKKSSDNDEGGTEGANEGDEVEDNNDPHKKLPRSRKRKKVGEALSSPDDFFEIDNLNGLMGKSMNETKQSDENKMKFHEKIPNLFIKNKSERKRIDVCLNKANDDRDDSRVKDWTISLEFMLVKEMYTSSGLDNSVLNISVTGNQIVANSSINDFFNASIDNAVVNNASIEAEVLPPGNPRNVPPAEAANLPSDNPSLNVPLPDAVNDDDDDNNNVPDLDLSASVLQQQVENEKFLSTENRDKVVEAMNVSMEDEFGRLPNVREPDKGALVDVNEPFWNATKFDDIITSKPQRTSRISKTPCRLCFNKSMHRKKEKNCVADEKIESLDTYFFPHVQPAMSEPQFGTLPDEELLNIYKAEKKVIEQLAKADHFKNINEAYESPEVIQDFLGFDGFENYLMTKKPAYDDDEPSEDDLALDNVIDDDNVDNNEPNDDDVRRDFEIPLPVTETSTRHGNTLSADDVASIGSVEKSQLEYQRIVLQETQGLNSAKSCFERNKELGIKISQWHASLAEKIETSQKRGALNMNVLAEKIMDSFPKPKNGEKPMLTFRSLVKNQSRKDVPRYFLACLQLTNEGNINIHKLSSSPLTTDCMAITKLRETRIRQEFDEYSTHNSSKSRIDERQANSQSRSPALSKRKRVRNSMSSSSEDDEDSDPERTKKKKMRSEKQNSRKRRSKTPDTNKNRKKQKGGG